MNKDITDKKLLLLAIYCEGPTDFRFLNRLVPRLCKNLLNQHNVQDWIVNENVFWVNENLDSLDKNKRKEKLKQSQSLLKAAEAADLYHILFVHCDSDTRSYDETVEQSFKPGYSLVLARASGVCKQLVPIIAVREIEAWLLADAEAFYSEVSEHGEFNTQNLPLPPIQILEKRADPKNVIIGLLKNVISKKRKNPHKDISQLYAPLGDKASLEKLERLSAFQKFKQELEKSLMELKIIRPTN